MSYVSLSKSVAFPFISSCFDSSNRQELSPLANSALRVAEVAAALSIGAALTADALIGITLGAGAVLTCGNYRLLNTVAVNHLDSIDALASLPISIGLTLLGARKLLDINEHDKTRTIPAAIDFLQQTMDASAEDSYNDAKSTNFLKRHLSSRCKFAILAPIYTITATAYAIVGFVAGVFSLIKGGKDEQLTLDSGRAFAAFGSDVKDIFGALALSLNPTLQRKDLYDPKSISAYCNMTGAFYTPTRNYVVDHWIKPPEGDQTTLQMIEHFAKKQIAARIASLFLLTPIGFITSTADLLIGTALGVPLLLTGGTSRDLNTYTFRHLWAGKPLHFLLANILRTLNPGFQEDQKELKNILTSLKKRLSAEAFFNGLEEHHEKLYDDIYASTKPEEIKEKRIYSRIGVSILISTIQALSFAILSVLTAPLSIATFGQIHTLNNITISSCLEAHQEILGIFTHFLSLINPYSKPTTNIFSADGFFKISSKDAPITVSRMCFYEDISPTYQEPLAPNRIVVEYGLLRDMEVERLNLESPFITSYDKKADWWRQALNEIPEGTKRRFCIHPNLAYGKGAQLPPTFVLVIDVERGKAETPLE